MEKEEENSEGHQEKKEYAGSKEGEGTEKEKEPEKQISLQKRVATELIGTFMLVFVAVGADVVDAATTTGGHELGKLAVVAAPGFVLTALIYATDKISGAYFNPAISIGLVLSGHLKVRDLPFYIIAQIAGAVLASVAVSLVIGQSGGSAGLTVPHVGWQQAFAAELIFTYLLMFTAISLKEQVGYKPFGGIAVGAVVIGMGIVGASVSGASMNPARSLGPALVAGNLAYQWIYWAAPIVGAVLATFSFKAIKGGGYR
jgi:aquaporin Z